MMNSSPSKIELNHVSQSFMANNSEIELFTELSLSIEQGQSYAITGPSGSGKSSLLMLMAGLAEPSKGEGCCVQQNQRKPLSELRERTGFIFQQFHLLPELTVLNNVALPLRLRGQPHAQSRAGEWLDRVGLSKRLHHKPHQLSGGEQQRAAIARALVYEPLFIFADEPTGNLDQNNAAQISDLLFECCHEKEAGLVVVTHSLTLANRAEHLFSLADGDCHLISNANREARHDAN